MCQCVFSMCSLEQAILCLFHLFFIMQFFKFSSNALRQRSEVVSLFLVLLQFLLNLGTCCSKWMLSQKTLRTEWLSQLPILLIHIPVWDSQHRNTGVFFQYGLNTWFNTYSQLQHTSSVSGRTTHHNACWKSSIWDYIYINIYYIYIYIFVQDCS